MRSFEKFRKKTIKTKIIGSFVLLTLIILGAQVIFNLFFAKNYFMNWNKTQIEDYFYEIKDNYSDDESVLYELTESKRFVRGFMVQVFSDEGLIYSGQTVPEGMAPELSGRNNQGPILDSARDHMQIDMTEFSENPQVKELERPSSEMGSSLILQGKFLYEGEERYIFITASIEAIDTSIQMFTLSSSIIAAIILLFGVIVIVLLTRSITRPIKGMEEVSRKMALLDFTDTVEEDADTIELSSLANSINSLSSQLQTAITGLQDANEQLQEDVDYQKKVDEMRRQFIANVSHEMKTPLALLQIYCENLKNNVEGIDRDEYCDIIIEETGRLDSMVKDMLHVSTIENGLMKLENNKINLSESTSLMMTTIRPLLDRCELLTDIEDDLWIQGDKKHIEEAMRNYLMNALTHTLDGGHIHVCLKKHERSVLFSVYNDGARISEGEIEKIWESFYKTDKSRTRISGSNAGLGLYVVKAVVQSHKGQYGVKNKENGVEFWFALPLIEKLY